ncbi:MAG TPA: 6-phosphofructokinase [Abditibacteriaceae bacterium]|nr:6-phosphofructokinase [Abditibacteriaceae bacterium]
MAEQGENCLIAVAGHPTTVTNSTIAGIIDETGTGAQIADVFGAVAGVQGLLEGKMVDMGAQKRKTIEGLRRTPGSVLAGRHRLFGAGEATALIEVLRANEIGVLFMLGGLPAIGLLRYFIEAAAQADYPLLALGIGLSAENDVAAGDHTPGYGSAARFAAGAARDAGRAAASDEEPLLVFECLGAQTGWLAAATALARDAHNPAPHAILVPERPVALETLVEDLQRAYHKYGYVVAVTTEGAQDTSGNALDGPALTAILSKRLNIAGRYDRPGSLARVGQAAVARADADNAYNVGSLAVRLAGDECSGYVVTVQRDAQGGERGDKGYKSVEGTARLEQVGDGPRLLPAEYITDNGTNVTEEFLDWARPLIGGALPEYSALD